MEAWQAAPSLILDDGWDDEPDANASWPHRVETDPAKEQVPLSKKAPLLIDGARASKMRPNGKSQQGSMRFILKQAMFVHEEH